MSAVDVGEGTFAVWLKEMRAKRGWTQGDLMYRARIKEPMLSKYEHERHVPTLDTFLRLVAVFGEWPPLELAERHLLARTAVVST